MKSKIINLLRQIQYPGYDRDIVSFGMVSAVRLEGKSIQIDLGIKSSNESNKQNVHESVQKIISENFSDYEIIVNLVDVDGKQSAKTASHHAHSSNDPWANQTKLPQINHVIAIASGKGGVGKSTIATNLAVALAEKKFRVGLLDLDVYGPSMQVLLGENKQPEITDEQKILPLTKYGMKIMSFGFLIGDKSPVIWRGPMVAKLVDQFFNDIEWGSLDYLILDLPPGTGDVQLSLVQRVKLTGAIVITTPQDLSLADVRRGADMFRQTNTPVLGVIENMSNFICPHCGNSSEIFGHGGGIAESARLNLPLLAQIPLLADIVTSSDAGKPIVLNRELVEIRRVFMDLAESIVKIVKQQEEQNHVH